MTVEARFLENAGSVNNARDDRRLLLKTLTLDPTTTPGIGAGGVLRYTGVATTGDLAVTQTGGGAMSVTVLAGAAYVHGTQSATQGGYIVYNDASAVLTIDPSDAVLDRYDVIAVQARDTEYTPGTDDGRIFVVKGTPGAGLPTLTGYPNLCVLAEVLVSAGATSILTAKITDRRRGVAALGGVVPCTNATRPDVNLRDGIEIFEVDTRDRRRYNYSGTYWAPADVPAGTLIDTIRSAAPPGCLLAYGQTLTNANTDANYKCLWTEIDAAFKSGNNVVLPDLRGRGTHGLDNMGGSDAGRLGWANTMGNAGGSEKVALNPQTELSGSASGIPAGVASVFAPNWYGGAPTAHENMPPTILVNKAVRY